MESGEAELQLLLAKINSLHDGELCTHLHLLETVRITIRTTNMYDQPYSPYFLTLGARDALVRRFINSLLHVQPYHISTYYILHIHFAHNGSVDRQYPRT